MNNYEKLTTSTLEDFAIWLDKYGQFDDSPWMTWFNSKYCANCPSIEAKRKSSLHSCDFDIPITCAYCEIHNKCKYFPDVEEIPDNVNIIEMWLKEKVDNI